MSSGGAAYLVGDLASKMFDGKFREGHFRLQIQWVVAMVIVTLLEKGVVCRLTSPRQTLNQLFQSGKQGKRHLEAVVQLQWGIYLRYLGKTALVIQNPQYPMGLSGN